MSVFFTRLLLWEERKRKEEGKGKRRKSLAYNNTLLNPVFHLLSLTLVEKYSSEVSSHAAFIYTLKHSYNNHHNNNSIHEEHYYTEKKLITASFEISNKNVVAFYFFLPGNKTWNTIQLKMLSLVIMGVFGWREWPEVHVVHTLPCILISVASFEEEFIKQIVRHL